MRAAISAQSCIGEKTLEAYNDVFADIVNVLLFHGERRVREEDLEDAQILSQYKAENGTLREQERDVSKFWKDVNFRIAMFRIEGDVR